MATGLTMKALMCKNYGDISNVLEMNTLCERPKLGDNQILIKNMASSINPMDWKMIRGDYSSVMKKSFPFIPGTDMCGIVELCGKNVKRFKVGDQVYGDLGTTGGAFAEYISVDETNVGMKPSNLTFAEAACLPTCALTAYQALHVHGKCQKGQKILIIGASGGVGHIACQMAKAIGLNVTGVCSSAESIAFCKSLGVDKIIDNQQESWGQTLKGQEYNCILDCVGGQEQWVQADQNVLAKGGIFITTVGDDNNVNDNNNPNNKVTIGTVASTAASTMARKFWSNFGEHHRYEIMLKYNGKPEELDHITALCHGGNLKPHIEKKYHFTQQSLLEMFHASQLQKTNGKLCLLVREEQADSEGGTLKGQFTSLNKVDNNTPYNRDVNNQYNSQVGSGSGMGMGMGSSSSTTGTGYGSMGSGGNTNTHTGLSGTHSTSGNTNISGMPMHTMPSGSGTNTHTSTSLPTTHMSASTTTTTTTTSRPSNTSADWKQ